MTIRLTLLFLSIFILSKAQNYSGDSWAQAKAKSQATISLAYVETPSFVYKDKAGNLTGICVDIMSDFVNWAANSKKIKITSNYVADGSNFKGMYDKVKTSSGGVFGLGNITITEERKKEVKFSPSYITNFAILITPEQCAYPGQIRGHENDIR